MKKLSFIMAVIMIVMTFPMMFMTSASAADVAVDADAPDMLPQAGIGVAGYELYQYASDADAVADGAIGRFTKEGGNGYAKTWKAVGGNAGDGRIGAYSHFFLLADYDLGNTMLGNNQNTAAYFDLGGGTRSLTIDGGLGTNRNFKVYGTGRLIHYNPSATYAGTLTFKNLTLETTSSTGTIQVNNGSNKFTLALENCLINANCSAAGGTGVIVFSDALLKVTNCTVNGIRHATSNAHYFVWFNAAAPAKAIITNTTYVGSRGFNFNNHGDKTVEITNCKFDIAAPASSGGLVQTTAKDGVSGNKITIKNSTVDASYGFVDRTNMDVTIENSNFTVKNNLIHVDDKKVTNSVFNINGGVYTSTNGKILNSQTTQGTTYNFYDGTFVVYNLKDEPVAAGNGESVGNKGMFYLSNCKALNIYGGSYTLYKDHGMTLCEKSPIILGWAAGGLNTTVYGGKFTGGSCFFAKVKNDSNAKFDEAGSIFYGYGEGKNTITIAPEVVKGASVRLDTKSGLRFTSTIAANTINYLNAALVKAETELTYGTIITRASYLKYTGGEFTMAAFDKAGKNYVNVVAKDGIVKNADGSVTINAALVDIDAENYDKDFVAMSYIKYTNANDEEVYLYATNVTLAENARNMEEVALAALADVKTKAEGAYTNAVSEYYVYNVAARKYELYTGTAYSAYTAEQVKALQSYIVVEE